MSTLHLDPADQFRAHVLGMQPGESYIYHRGRLAQDRFKYPSLHLVAIMASGLRMLGVVDLTQVRVPKTDVYEYRLRTKRSVRNVDFDHGRKTYLEKLEEE